VKSITLVFCLFLSTFSYAQNTFKALVKDRKSAEPLISATARIPGSKYAARTDSTGLLTLNNLPNGRLVLEFSYVGYQTRRDTLVFPLTGNQPLLIFLEPSGEGEGEELSEVQVTSTRTSRSIANTPTRIEVISGEELEEKGNMKPGDIRMLLAESTGIQTQQTSATSANSSIRIQGLDGKYTQIIRDGFPLYSGFSGGLGLLQIAPLDLQQVEVIKGSASTLYGGGAIAGLVNLVSRVPGAEQQMNVLLNGTSAGGLDASAFYSNKFKNTGATVYAAYNHGSPYDPADIGLTAIPRFNRYTLNPKIFLYLHDKLNVDIGLNATVENRIGGNMDQFSGTGILKNGYFEENKTGRYSSQVQAVYRLSEAGKITVKNSFGYFDRSIALPEYKFSGKQLSSYSEATYTHSSQTADWVAGLSYVSDRFREDPIAGIPVRDYNQRTLGAFVQNTWNVAEQFSLESGLRGDYTNHYGFFLLPRLSALWKINAHVSTRLGGGFGYKAPTVFTEDAERIQFRNVLPLDVPNTSAERSFGLNYDINYVTGLFDNQLGFSINQMFFYTGIRNPILLRQLAGGNLDYVQPKGNLKTRGMETNVKLTHGNFKLFLGYTFADVKQDQQGQISSYPLVSRHRLNNVLMYEVEEKWKIGAEAYYFSRQLLNDGQMGKAYWTTGLMAEKIWEGFSLFINFENLTDTRQTKFDTIYTGSISNPEFRDIYAPLDGLVVNGGIKIRL
jgi:iron complex outermembrane receptor protein